MQTSVSSRLIVALETFAIAVLAVVIVIYAQVLWQQSQQVPPVVVETLTPEALPETAGTVSQEERNRVLEELSAGSADAPVEERAAVLEQLGGVAEGEAVITETDRLEVLRALQGE